MLILLEDVLDVNQLQFVNDGFDTGNFNDGRISAGRDASRDKRNQELIRKENTKGIDNVLMGALVRHPVYLNAGLPHRVAAPLYCRYYQGMRYGWHFDDPIMGQGERYRCDVAITIFLCNPETYEGGELEIDTSFGTQIIKEKAGNGVMYPASSRHRVREVLSGERRVAVTWMQSIVPEPDRRALLYQLFLAKEALGGNQIDDQAVDHVTASYTNLIRMWSRI